jgi:hypothetical protein
MTDTTAKPAVAATTVTSVISKDYSWVVAHLLSLGLVGVLVFASVFGIEHLIVDHDVANSNKYTQILNTQAAQTAAIQKQQQTDEAHFAVIETALLAQNAQLTKQITTRNQTVAVQVSADASLSAQQSAARLSQQTNAASGEIVSTNNSVTMDLPITRVITADLDRLALAQNDLTDTQTQLKNETDIATNTATENANDQKLIASQALQLTDASKACQAQIAVVKSQARKSKLKWFLTGLGIGLGLWAGHSL